MRLLIFLTLSCNVFVESYKILGAFPTFSRSHVIVASGLMKSLAKYGHNVTVLSPVSVDEPVENYRDIVIPIGKEYKEEIQKTMDLIGSSTHITKLINMGIILKLGVKIANESLHTPVFQKIMQEESFDLVITGIVGNFFLAGLAAHFKCPLILLNPFQSIALTDLVTGNPSSVQSVPHIFSTATGDMNFIKRSRNFLSYFNEFMGIHNIINQQRAFYNAIFPPDKYPTYEQMMTNISLVLINHHFSQGVPQAYVPAIVEIGGIHLKNKPSPLPEKIQKWLDGADEGAILFSFGTNIESSKLSPEMLDAILKTFSKLKQRILFKWERDSLPNKPDNVMVGKWLPQEDILAHTNTKIFITHAGKGSLVESQFHSVPVIGIPIFSDQMSNIEQAIQEGWGIRIDFLGLTEAKLSDAINELLTNSKYKEAAQRISFLYRDRPMTAQETANYWVEYVIRHRGAPHLQSPAVHLNFLQYHMIDAHAFITLSILLSIITLIFCIKHSVKFLMKQIFKMIRFKNKKE